MDYELQDCFFQREVLMDRAKNFLEQHADIDGKLTSTKDQKIFAELEKQISGLTNAISREMYKDSARPIYDRPNPPILYPEISNANNFSGNKPVINGQFGVVGDEYRQNFLTQVRSGFRTAANILQTSNPADGGYLLPSELHTEIVAALKNENVMRKICRVIQTQSEYQIPLQQTAPTTNFVGEGQAITLSNETFKQVSLSAYKCACGVALSNELLSDGAYDLESHLTQEFSASIGNFEENALLNGSGTNEPLGLLNVIASDTSMQKVTTGANISSDDLINLVYSLPAPYRKNAVFLMNDTTLAAIRKLKDANLAYIWENSMQLGEPSNLLGFPVYSSEHMPSIASGNLAILFGDFGKFIIGMRGNLRFRPLYEVGALTDVTHFLMIERFDGVLTDKSAIRALKIR